MAKYKKILKYSQEKMLNAINEVKQGKSVKATAKKYGVPRVTLMYKVSGKLPIGKRMGPKTIFTPEQENVLVEWIISMAKAGFPVTKDTFLSNVCKVAQEMGLESVPGKKWYKLFRTRNPRIADRVYQTLTRSRANVTTENVQNWFSEIWSYITERNLIEVMQNPSRVFNADETAFYMNPKGSKVLAEKGTKSVYLAGANDEKENVTILLTANAAGQIPPPMIVYRYKRVPVQIAEAVPPTWAIGKSENGWMTQELFYEYIANFFHPWLKEENIGLPVVFFLDGHSSHISLHLSEFCAENGIELVALYPNATHLIQPMDVAVFHSLKTDWKKRVQDWRMAHTGEELKKKDFPPLLQEVIKRIDPANIKNGFKKCGLVPWNPQTVTMPLKILPVTTNKNGKINEDTKTFLVYLDNEIGYEKLEQFKNNEGDWKGIKEDCSLYNIWSRNMKKLKQLPLQAALHGDPNFVNATSPQPNEQDLVSNNLQKTIPGPSEFQTTENKDSSAAISIEEEIIPGPSEFKTPEKKDSNAAISIEKEIIPGPSEFKTPEKKGSNAAISIEEEIIPGPSEFKTPEKKGSNAAISIEVQPSSSCQVTDPTIPSPFKRVLFWPEKKTSVSKRKNRERIPSALSSPQVIKYYKTKEENKQRKAEEMAKKKEERKQKIKEMQEKKKAAEEQRRKNKESGNNKRKAKQMDIDSTTSESLSLESDDSSSWNEDFEDLNADGDNSLLESVSFERLMEGDYVLCNFFGGKRNQTKFVYLCVVQEKGLNFQVMGLKSFDKAKKEFIPNELDVSSISFDQVIGRVPQPDILTRGERISYVFKNSLPVKEI